ncbi:UNVERIFIED_CONTAM: hypothetical protein GTU68_024272, partial [Idotea baltica]|nr:hypothetical protein [Idotea baltica]
PSEIQALPEEQRSSSSANCPSTLSEKSPKISRTDSASSPLPSWLFKKPTELSLVGLFEDTNLCATTPREGYIMPKRHSVARRNS